MAQDIVVTLVALAAAVIIARRVVGFARSESESAPKCAGCETGGCEPPVVAPGAGRPPTHPLVFIRSSRS